MIRRILCVVCPWYVLWRIGQLADHPPEAPYYDRWWEVRLNLGRAAVARAGTEER